MNHRSKSSLVLSREKINKLLLINVVILFIPSLIFFIWGGGLRAAYGCMLGGTVYAVCQYLFTMIFFSTGGAQQANQIIKRMFLGEWLKIVLSILVLTTIFYYQLAQPLPVVIGFVLMIMVGWFTPWLLKF